MSIPFTWIYLIHDPFTNYFKIGKSDNPDIRLKQLCNPSSYGTIPAAPTGYALIEAWLCPETTEREFHEAYKECRVHGEWFNFKVHYEGSPFPDTPEFVKKDLEEQWFRERERWVGESSFLEDEYYELLDSNERLWKQLHLYTDPLTLTTPTEAIN